MLKIRFIQSTGPFGVVLDMICSVHMLNTNEDMMKMARMVAYDEGLPVNSVILEPFLHRHLWMNFLMTVFRMNIWRYKSSVLQLMCHRWLSIRFGRDGKSLWQNTEMHQNWTAIPLGIAGWLRYMLAVDDEGKQIRTGTWIR